MVGGTPFQPEIFHQQLKQWTHFPEKLEESLENAKTTGTLSIGNRKISVNKDDTLKAGTLFRKIVEEVKSELTIKDLRNLSKISKRLQEPGDPSGSSNVKKVAYRVLSLEQQGGNAESAKQFSESFQRHQSFDIDQFRAQLHRSLENKNQTDKEEFAKALALEAPALLFFAFPDLNIDNPQTKQLLAKLVTSNPFSTGLSPNLKNSVLKQINIGEWLNRFRVQEQEHKLDNIRGLLGYLVELGKSEFEALDSARFPRHILRFLHFANGVLRYGVVCRKRAERLGIGQITSLDKYSGSPKEVKVNSIQENKGIPKALYHMAKGAITIATERQVDTLSKNITTIRLEEGLSKSIIKDPSFLAKKLEERIHYSLLVICTTNTITFTENDGRPLPTAEADSIRKNCAMSAPDGCSEVPVNNINPSSFKVVLMSDRFEFYKELLIIPPGISEDLFCFVPSFTPTDPVLYAYRDEKDDAKTCEVKLSIPNFEEAIDQRKEELFKEGQIITHICKGKSPDDPY